MNTEIEELVKHCNACQESRPSPPAAPLHPWEWPSKPWSRLHLDFAGPFLGHSYLILVDAYSKWLDVHIMNSTTSAKTIEKLRMVFSVHGLPHKIVTDNGTAFTSNEFRQFMAQNGIKHVTSAPYHPSSNGQAERAVQTSYGTYGRHSDSGKNFQIFILISSHPAHHYWYVTSRIVDGLSSTFTAGQLAS